MGKVRKNLIGQKFGRLTVVDFTDDIIDADGRVRVRWLCKCDCGTVLPVRAEALRSGNTKSCGCYDMDRKKSTAGKCKKHNPYVIRNNYVILYTYKNEPFLVDIEDFYKVYNHCWYSARLGYLKAKICGKSVFLHRYIMGYMDCKHSGIDHKSGNVWDNRKQNLRGATQSENTMNSSIRSDSTSGVTGVSQAKNNKWLAYIYLKGKQIRLGSYNNKEDAIAARHKAEDELFGEYSYRRSRGK